MDKKKMDFWLLVDGQMRFESIGKIAPFGPHEISIPLTDNDKFLTLVSTDGGVNAGYDWGFFAEPQLEIIPEE